MRKIVLELLFFATAAIILPTPTMIWAWGTGKTLTQVLYR